ncbi:pentapeptide repeat-containing protein [Candidatus Albibeggiatoa sp. nov. NOAA]|uniref:pentapeptide repeat-containing protein n=1 Tax=Candidatus Albibeggiatoa sp. nov. NOAA TaxID=3162724 RepID=UPI0033054AA7|nr:pentapeptide repeat-containing protein [Thiotrichaceae bacterium]
MPQDFSGQKLYGRSFVGQDLKEAKFKYVKTGARWYNRIAAYSTSVSLLFLFIIVLEVFALLITKWSAIQIGVILLTLGTIRSIFRNKFNGFIHSLVTLLQLLILFFPLLIFTSDTHLFSITSLLFLLFIIVGTFSIAATVIEIMPLSISLFLVVFFFLTIYKLQVPSIDKLISEITDKPLVTDVEIFIFICLAFFAVPILIIKRFYQEDSQFSYLHLLGLQFVIFESTSFKQADLTEANFYKANLKHANFSDAILVRTDFREAQNLKLAYVKNTILEQKAVREVLVHGKTEQTDFKKMDLYGAYLVEADLQWIDFTDVNFNQANLSGANLRNANLTRIQAIGANFENADLTGACLEAWNIDATTNINNVHADYVYLKNDQQERRPSSGTFSDGEFSKLFQELLDTVDLIFKDGLNWQALVDSLDDLRDKIRVESDGEQEINVTSIENKGDNVFVVRVAIPKGLDKAKIHQNMMSQYNKLKRLATKQRAQLIQKDALLIEKEKTIDKLFNSISSQQPINIHTGQQNMFDKNDNRRIQVGGSVSNSNLNVGDNVNQPAPTSNEAPLEIIDQIQDLINRTDVLEEIQKQGLSFNVGMIRKAFIEGTNPAALIPAVHAIVQDCSNADFINVISPKIKQLEHLTQN